MRAREAAAPRAASTPRLPVHVVFVDGHNAGPMDDGWLALFLRCAMMGGGGLLTAPLLLPLRCHRSSINYIKHLPDGVCFGDAILAPFGCVLWPARAAPHATPRRPRCTGTTRLSLLASRRAGETAPPNRTCASSATTSSQP